MKKISIYFLVLVLPFFFSCSQDSGKVSSDGDTPAKTEKAAAINGDFIHVVYFWLKDPANADARKSFENSLSNFINNSEFIATKHIGTPADTDREVIDNSYTYSLILTFKSKVEQDKYQEEAGHKKFIEESSDLWEKVLVYDSEDMGL